MFSWIDWQFQRRWHLGTRYDYTQFPDTNALHEQGVGIVTEDVGEMRPEVDPMRCDRNPVRCAVS